MKKKCLIILATSVSLILIVIFLEYLEKEPRIKIKFEAETSVFKDAKFIQKKDGKIITEIDSKEAILSENNQMNLNDVKIFFPEREFTVRAQKGVYYTNTSKFLLSGNIEAEGKNLKFYAEEAYWDPEDKTIYSDKPLKIEAKNFIIEGNSGRAKSNLIELRNGVRAVVYVKS